MLFTPIALAILSLFPGLQETRETTHTPASIQTPAQLSHSEGDAVFPGWPSRYERSIDFTLVDTGGKTVNLADFKGKFVVLDMWASFCKPCLVETQPTHELQEKYKDKNLVWVYISFDKNRRDWLNAIKRHNLQGVHLLAGSSSERLKKDFNIQGIPFYVWVDEKGKIVEENAPRPSENAAKKLKYYLSDKEE